MNEFLIKTVCSLRADTMWLLHSNKNLLNICYISVIPALGARYSTVNLLKLGGVNYGNTHLVQ